MRVIGLTGGIGTGKSTLAAALAELGASIVDADAEGHAAYRPGAPGWRRVADLFGLRVIGDAGAINRKALGDVVFNDPEAMQRLNEAVHPLIRERVEARLAALREQGARVAVLHAALLLQAGWDDLVDEVWTVTAPPGAAAERLAARRGLTPEEAQARIEAQGPQNVFVERADIIIENDGTSDDLRQKARSLWAERVESEGATNDPN